MASIYGLNGDSDDADERGKDANSTPNSASNDEPSFTLEEEKLYVARYEGFNIFDAKSIKWLQLNHPSESLVIPPDTSQYGEEFTSSLPSLVHFPSSDDLAFFIVLLQA